MQNDTQPTTTPISDSYDVVVVGARAAGAATAMLLARRGVKVLAIDRAAYGSDTLSTLNIALPGVLQLSRWGVLDEIRAAGTPAATTVNFNYGADRAHLQVPERGDVDGLYSPRRTLLDSSLVDAAIASGAEVRHGVSLIDVTRDAAGRVDGVAIDRGGTRHQVRARFVIGADGVRSKVAALVGSMKHHEDVAAASIYSFRAGLPGDRIDNFYEVGSAGGIIPTNDGLAIVWTSLPPTEFATSARGDLSAAQQRQLDGLPGLRALVADAEPVGGYRGFPGIRGYLREPAGPGWALVGDASYFKDPLSAHGITDAFIGAEMVADAVADVIVCGVDEAAVFARYRAERDLFASEMMPAVARVASLQVPLPDVAQAFKDMATAMRHEWAYLESKMAVPTAA